jgi:hypothetical protein
MSMQRFMVKKSDMDKRWDPFYFQPYLVKLEAKVKAKTSLRLRDFVRFKAGGATPLKSEGEQHYTDAKNGIPFIRVQNLSTTGQLDLAEVKHITKATHEGMLARSQLGGGELLVKITGVGRMAVASVVPDGFSANINQHIVAIRTANVDESKSLAAYLNLDFVEQLASRRATGGTRPALDYPALLSIPIINDARIVTAMHAAYSTAQQLELKAACLLGEVTTFMYSALSLVFSDSSTAPLNSRIFSVAASQLSGNIFDPKTHAPRSVALLKSLLHTKFPTTPLRELITHRMAGDWGEDEDFVDDNDEYERRLVIRGTEFDNELNLRIENGREKYRLVKVEKLNRMQVEVGDILIEKSGGSPDQPVGRVVILEDALLDSQSVCYSNFVEKIKPDPAKVLPAYLFHYLRFVHTIGVTDLLQSQTNGIRNLMIHRYLGLPVSLPTLSEQAEIVSEINTLQAKAIALRANAKEVLDVAKHDVEKMILGD